jgi:DtxR family transcriptional regulator, Mn-dependent transcriptional regulator
MIGVAMSDLIDTTEMYLRTVFELQEEGITPMRARIAERLSQSGPTVSQTVARMERDGLLVVTSDRHLELTSRGREAAVRVMRKHRLAECMLIEMLHMPWEYVHAEACRWEHVMSDAVERQIMMQLGHPTVSPYGNPIPGLQELDPKADAADDGAYAVQPITEVVSDDVRRCTVRRLTETIQSDQHLMTSLRRAGVTPGATVRTHRAAEGIMVGSAGEYVEVPHEMAAHILVDAHD